MDNQDYERLIAQWHKDRNLIDGSTDKDQYLKLIQEAGELSDSLCKNKDIRDDIGDMMVVLINIMARNHLSINECLSVAYNDIKDRKGKMIDGVFVKEGDDQIYHTNNSSASKWVQQKCWSNGEMCR